jgi:CRISPR-associated protein Cas1
MLDAEIPAGALFYGKTRRRQDVIFNSGLRRATEDAAKRYHELVEPEVTPKPVYSKKCDNGSMYDLCMPKTVEKARSINNYLKDFIFRDRNRRPPLDRVNCLLSFLYTLVLHDVRSALESVGLDSAVGFLHRDRPGRPSLALDMMEEFRPFLADRL